MNHRIPPGRNDAAETAALSRIAARFRVLFMGEPRCGSISTEWSRLSFVGQLRRRGIPARIGSLVMLIQRSPLLKLLPEARVLSTSGFSEAVKFTVMTVAGLGAFDSVSGATVIAQTSPTSGSPTVNLTGGAFSNFAWQVTGFPGSLTASIWTISGTVPAGLVHADLRLSHSSFMSGVPTQSGSFPVTITVWEDPNATTAQRSISGNFVINVAAPPAPAISVPPLGGNFTPGSFVNLIATQTSGYSFVWKKDGQPISNVDYTLTAANTPRRFLIPTTDPGVNWRSGVAFNDSTWTAVSGGIGYDTQSSPVNYIPSIAVPGGNVQSQMSGTGKPTSALIRIPFTMSAPGAISSLKFRVQSDDGFVAWLNGTEIAFQNRFASLAFNSAAANSAVDATAAEFREINISRFITALRSGQNLLAVQAMNTASTPTDPSDFLFNCELIGGTDATSTRRLILPSVQAAHAGSYTVTITNTAGSVTSAPAVIVLPPSIETHPESVLIQSGETATLTVGAVTSPPFTYQWFRGISGDTANPVTGATGVSFTTPPLTASEKYWVRVSNPAGSANSNTAEVNVIADIPPVISSQPESVTIDGGTTAQLSVTASGTAPFSYQWYTGASGDTAGLIAGATGSTFTTPVLTVTTGYWVRVTNAAGFDDSDTATVTVRDPFITWQRARFTSEELAVPEISGPAADPDGDGVTNDDEYVFGTLPTTAQPSPGPSIGFNGQIISLTFVARSASGPGYAGRVRHYAIEITEDVSTGPWNVLPLFADIIASDQTLTCLMPPGFDRTFCRLRIWLAP